MFLKKPSSLVTSHIFDLKKFSFSTTYNTYAGSSRDYYQILGVPKKASPQEIKKAFYTLAKKYHPDVSNNSNTEIIKEINQAYEVLSNADSRRLYDQKLDGDNFEANRKTQYKDRYNEEQRRRETYKRAQRYNREYYEKKYQDPKEIYRQSQRGMFLSVCYFAICWFFYNRVTSQTQENNKVYFFGKEIDSSSRTQRKCPREDQRRSNQTWGQGYKESNMLITKPSTTRIMLT